MPAISYQPDKCTMSYGLYVCRKCESSFYGGGAALHQFTCELIGYKDTCYCFGNNESWRLYFDIARPSQEIIDAAKSAPNEIIEY